MKEIKNKKGREKELKDALIKKALGYDTTEIVEEYVGDNEGEIKLLKKKVTTKNVPPDMSAIKMLMEEEIKQVEEMSDEELIKERDRLINLIKEENKCKEKK